MGGSRPASGIRLAVLAAITAVVATAAPAQAACHAFTVEVDPASVTEGSDVAVTVSRDAAVGPSQIDVETVDGSATGGADYETVARRTVSFSNETSQTFTVPTFDDGDAESAETFALHLSNPGGCTVNPNFVVGPDATVTITDNDAASTTSAPAPTPTSARPSTTAEANADTSSSTTSTDPAETTTSATATTSTSATVDDVAAPVTGEDDRDGDGAPVGAILLALVVVIAAGAGAALAWRRRSGVS